ncbi:hypothetical protein [Demequina lignilytica]|uniref:Restriction endonuclease, SacI family n=1 Tax=Demequina lignilytica TaxID=3051663 RepID=A0AB35MJP0_9MICO|nr:hypothetical protein [Demequina sp. SYSU T0a273]MDN4484025.1 hypothetical protein [Demequina sp. SYSU T0a273]
MKFGELIGARLAEGMRANALADRDALKLHRYQSENVDIILESDSVPNRQFLLAILATVACDGTMSAAALQAAAGADRRSHAKVVGDTLAAFRRDNGLTLKTSKDPGVSNQWRELEINEEWAGRRKAPASKLHPGRTWASAFLSIVRFLESHSSAEAKSASSGALLAYSCTQVVVQALGNQLDYPRFRVSVPIAMDLVDDFLDAAPNRPDAMEAVVTAAARTLAIRLGNPLKVVRGDTNAPDPIDVLLVDDADMPDSGIEVTDAELTTAKLRDEVIPAMFHHGISRALVVCPGIKASDVADVESLLRSSYLNFEQRIDIVDIDTIGTWLVLPGLPAEAATEFMWDIGSELDALSIDGNRRAWHKTLTDHVRSTLPTSLTS